MLILGICNDVAIIGIIYFINNIIKVLCVVTPVLLLLMLTIDFVQAVIAGDSERMDKVKGKAIQRIVYAVLVFLVPFIVKGVMGLLGNSTNFSSCYEVAENDSNLQLIEQIREIEAKIENAKTDAEKEQLIQQRDALYKQLNGQ